MGSTLDRPETLNFDVTLTDPDADNSKDAITKIDIVKDGGLVAETLSPGAGSHAVTWKPVIHDSASKYFFIRVYNAGGGDAPGAKPGSVVAWLAPVWTGR
jgi:hypothetical protein